jgi:hypothetical protein
MSDPSKAASPTTQHAVQAAIWLLFAVGFFFSQGKFLPGAIPVLIVLVYLGLAGVPLAIRRDQRHAEAPTR